MDPKNAIEEFKRCKADPAYFISKYIKVTHPVRGLVNFELYPFQKRIVKELTSHRFNILRKFRQAGCTTIAASYALWKAIFAKYQTIPIISKGDQESTEVLERIKLMYDELPDIMKPGIEEDNKHTLKLKNGSTIRCRASGKQSGRSLAGSLLIVDEAAFIENIDTIWAAVYPVISTGGAAFILSTVNGIGNWFHDMYNGAINNENSFNAVDIKWQEHPEYKKQKGYEELYQFMMSLERPLDVEKWEETTKSNISPRKWLQEYECDFLGTGDTYVDGEILNYVKSNVSEDFYIKYNNRMRVWKDPNPSYEYVLAADVSLGRGRDYSAFQIINMYNGEQVAEFYSNRTPINEFAQVIATEANLYNTAAVISERNTIGNNLIDWLFTALEYENIWIDDKGNMGYQVTHMNREVLLADLEESIRTSTIRINSDRTVEELFTFIIAENGKAEAEQGYHDDLVMSLALAVYGYNNIMETTPIEHMRGTSINRPLTPIRTTKYTVNTNGPGGISEEDLKWLMK